LGFQESDKWESNFTLSVIKNSFTWLLMFTSYIPISLMVTLEFVKFIQCWFMS